MRNGKWKKSAVLCIPMAEGAYIAGEDDPEGGCLYAVTEGGIEALFRRAAQEGFAARRVILAVNGADLSLESRRFPDMTESELAETLFWEADRIFPSAVPLRMDWTALSHSPEGWTVAAAACPAPVLGEWRDAARRTGRRLCRAVPPLPREGETMLLIGHASALALSFEEGMLRKRRLEPEDAAELPDGWTARPAADCTEDDWTRFRSACPAMPSREEAVRAWAARMRSSPLNLAFPEDRDQPFFCRANRWLRLSQAACLLFAAAAAVSGLHYAAAERNLAAEEARAASLTEEWRALSGWRKARADAGTARAEGRAFIEADPHWEQRLLYLADVLPAGLSIRSISSEGGTVRVEGAALRSALVPDFQSRLAAAWGMDCRIESLRREKALPYERFVLLCRAQEGGGA